MLLVTGVSQKLDFGTGVMRSYLIFVNPDTGANAEVEVSQDQLETVLLVHEVEEGGADGPVTEAEPSEVEEGSSVQAEIGSVSQI